MQRHNLTMSQRHYLSVLIDICNICYVNLTLLPVAIIRSFISLICNRVSFQLTWGSILTNNFKRLERRGGIRLKRNHSNAYSKGEVIARQANVNSTPDYSKWLMALDRWATPRRYKWLRKSDENLFKNQNFIVKLWQHFSSLRGFLISIYVNP